MNGPESHAAFELTGMAIDVFDWWNDRIVRAILRSTCRRIKSTNTNYANSTSLLIIKVKNAIFADLIFATAMPTNRETGKKKL